MIKVLCCWIILCTLRIRLPISIFLSFGENIAFFTHIHLVSLGTSYFVDASEPKLSLKFIGKSPPKLIQVIRKKR